MARSSVLADYINLTKPRITVLNMITTLAALWVATGGRPGWSLAIPALLGTALAVAGGAVLNCWVERDRDGLMHRTRNRPLPSGRVPANHALIFGIVLSVAGVGVLLTTNMLAAVIAAAGIIFYAAIYTALLKGTTHWNTVLGSISGAVPPLIGWAAAQGSINAVGWAIAGLVFVWQPVHFWALAMLYAEDYQRAGIKMLPVTHGFTVTRHHILRWTVYLVAVSLAIYFMGLTGPYYLVGAAGMGGVLLLLAFRNLRDHGLQEAARLFHTSNIYLGMLYLLLIIDCGCKS